MIVPIPTDILIINSLLPSNCFITAWSRNHIASALRTFCYTIKYIIDSFQSAISPSLGLLYLCTLFLHLIPKLLWNNCLMLSVYNGRIIWILSFGLAIRSIFYLIIAVSQLAAVNRAIQNLFDTGGVPIFHNRQIYLFIRPWPFHSLSVQPKFLSGLYASLI